MQLYLLFVPCHTILLFVNPDRLKAINESNQLLTQASTENTVLLISPPCDIDETFQGVVNHTVTLL